MTKILLAALFVITTCATALAADISLPAPKKDGGPSVLAAIESRSSAFGENFPQNALSQEELGTLLWAASGRNRGGEGWTVPTAMHRDPYCDIYVATDVGTFLYIPKDHALRQVTADNIKDAVGKQAFAQKAHQVLIFVANGKAGTDERQVGFANVLVGAMTQNIYLAAEALGVKVRYVASLNAEAVRTRLKLAKEDLPIAILPVGK